MKKKEIQALWENYPDLFERAIALEHGSAKTNVNVKGLGRDWSWESYYNEFMANKEFEEAQLTFDQLFPDSPGGCICGAPCGCYDGYSFVQRLLLVAGWNLKSWQVLLFSWLQMLLMQ